MTGHQVSDDPARPVIEPDNPVEAYADDDDDDRGRLTLDVIEEWAARMRARGARGGEPAYGWVRNGQGVHAGRLTRLTSYPHPDQEGPRT